MTRVVLGDLLRRAARRHPDGIAVVDRTDETTYAALDERSDRIARLLADLGVQRGDRVGLLLDKSASAVAGIYGVLKAGAAYVPIDAQAPAERAAYIAQNCEVRALLTARAHAGAWPIIADRAPGMKHLVVLDADGGDVADHADVGSATVSGADAVAAQEPMAPGVTTIDQDVAYVLYTSGSTGEPKGVTLTHRNAMAFVEWAAAEFAVGPADRLSSHAPFHFDLSIFDLFAAAWGAAPVVLVPHRASLFPIEVARFIRGTDITIWYSVPSILSALTARGGVAQGDFPELRTILFAGEVFPPKYLRALMGLLPDVRFANLYGPTETNVCTWYDVPPLGDDVTEPVPIGRTVANDETFVVTQDGRRAARGEVGELYVRGATVMRGYWGDPERTARSLVPDPFAADFADPVYRTGDLVREDADGNLHYLGRRDNQIKSRGYRIELGEIETALNAHPAVHECAVVAVPDELITNSIRAYIVGPADEQELIGFCRQRIPKYMIPQQFVWRDVLPKTSTGKIDRLALGREG
ncbi:MAG: amino acid adenylation domain-containing protein [Acidimicrobiales bacterium]